LGPAGKENGWYVEDFRKMPLVNFCKMTKIWVQILLKPPKQTFKLKKKFSYAPNIEPF